MAIFGFGRVQPQPPLGAVLSEKATELREKETTNARSAEYLLEEANRARQNSALAAKHAAAVEQAFTILEDAGVNL